MSKWLDIARKTMNENKEDNMGTFNANGLLITKDYCSYDYFSVYVTPDLARELLKKTNTKNRLISPLTCKKYARDLENGDWELNPQPIVFTKGFGLLLDGQHRLQAVVMSGVAQRFVFCTGVPESVQEVIDETRKRLAADRVRLSGTVDKYPYEASSTASAMIKKYVSASILTTKETMKVLENHKEAILFAVQSTVPKVKGISVAPVRAAIARAYYHVETELLSQFCDALMTGVVYNKNHSAAPILGRFLTSSHEGGVLAGQEKYWKTERAIQLFVSGQHVTRLFAASKELFLLPEEDTSKGPTSKSLPKFEYNPLVSSI